MVTALVLGALVGAGAGAAALVVLRRWDYRLEDEEHLPRRSLGWLVPTLAACSALLAVAHRDDPATLAVLLAATAVAGVLAAVDLDVHRLPDAIQLPAYPLLALALLGAALVSAEQNLADLGRALLGGLVALAVYVVLALLGGGQLGLGDVKLAGLIGMLAGWFSWSTLTTALVAGPVVGGLVGLVLVVARRATRKDYIPFGPPMMLGALLALVVA